MAPKKGRLPAKRKSDDHASSQESSQPASKEQKTESDSVPLAPSQESTALLQTKASAGIDKALTDPSPETIKPAGSSKSKGASAEKKGQSAEKKDDASTDSNKDATGSQSGENKDASAGQDNKESSSDVVKHSEDSNDAPSKPSTGGHEDKDHSTGAGVTGGEAASKPTDQADSKIPATKSSGTPQSAV